jgi:hypothetical protein
VRKITLGALILGAALAGIISWPVTHVRAAGQITDVSVDNRFPDELIFKATVTADADLARVELRYTALPDGTDAHGEPRFSPGKTATVEFALKVNDPPRAYFPAGTTFRYSWFVEDVAGNTFETGPAEYLFVDNRFEWQPVQAGNLTVYYYSGSRSYAEELAAIGNDGLNRTGALLGVTVPYPVRVWLYSDPEEMRPALQTRSERYSELVTTGGVRVASDLVFVAKGFAETEDTLRHELAHVVTKVAGEGAFGDVPSWLDEGTAVFSQNEPGGGYGGAVEAAIDGDRVLALSAMEAQPGDASLVNLFYGQSWHIVKFLVDTYGQERFAALFAELKRGSTINDALTAIYGLSTAGVDNAWREANGLAPRATATPTVSATATETPRPTFTPFSANPGTPTIQRTEPPGDQAPTTSAGQDEGGTKPGVILGLAVAAAALVVMLIAGGLALRKR